MGIMPAFKAQEIANSENLDLVKVAGKTNPPVCKIMDYGKYKFDMAKREKESKKNQHTLNIKEVRLSLNIGDHDLKTKAAQVLRFVNNGDKVKVSLRFRGREQSYTNIGFELMNRFAEICSEFASVERPAKLDGKCVLMFLTSKAKTNKNSKER